MDVQNKFAQNNGTEITKQRETNQWSITGSSGELIVDHE
jgi:hypothetical protein